MLVHFARRITLFGVVLISRCWMFVSVTNMSVRRNFVSTVFYPIIVSRIASIVQTWSAGWKVASENITGLCTITLTRVFVQLKFSCVRRPRWVKLMLNARGRTPCQSMLLQPTKIKKFLCHWKKNTLPSEQSQLKFPVVAQNRECLLFGTAQIQYLLESFILCCLIIHKFDT